MSNRFLDDILEHMPAVQEAQPKLAAPKKYKVYLLNDDYTPMDFVVDVLKRFFQMNEETAIQVMWQVHSQGKALCGVFTRDIAETKVALVNEYSKIHEHPLMSDMEPE